MSLTVLENGKFRDCLGSVLSNGYLLFELSHDEQDSGDNAQVVGGLRKIVQLDMNGNIAGAPSVEANDTLLPAGSFYIVKAYKQDATLAWKAPQYWVIPSSSPFDVGTLIPTNPPNAGGSGGFSLLLQTNGVNNSNQAIENLVAGSNITLTSASDGSTTVDASVGGNITISATSAATGTFGAIYIGAIVQRQSGGNNVATASQNNCRAVGVSLTAAASDGLPVTVQIAGTCSVIYNATVTFGQLLMPDASVNGRVIPFTAGNRQVGMALADGGIGETHQMLIIPSGVA